MEKDIHVYILAGGIGSRFWPQSRNNFPKQFLDILGTGTSLLQQTAERFSPFVPDQNKYVITNNRYRNLVQTQLPDLPCKNIICEPARNNTAPCIAYAAFKLYKENPDAVMVIVPSDHLVLKEGVYKELMHRAVQFAASNDGLITLGIRPTRPDTGYGYIEFSKEDQGNTVKKVLSFKEKPDTETAEAYLQNGSYLWNAGMFVWKAFAILDAFRNLRPDIYQLFEKGIAYYNTNKEDNFVRENYPKAPNISIDFAIMEKSDRVYTLPADIGWSDLGTWNSLHNVYTQKDDKNNVVLTQTHHIKKTDNCLISAPKGKLVVIDGLKNYIVVDNENVLLIYPKDKEQEIKAVTTMLKENNLSQFL